MARPTTPTAILKLRGSPHAKERAGEVQLPDGAPPIPPWVTAKGREIWAQVVGMLEPSGVLTLADGATLGRYVETLVRWARALEAIAAEGRKMANGIKRSFILTIYTIL